MLRDDDELLDPDVADSVLPADDAAWHVVPHGDVDAACIKDGPSPGVSCGAVSHEQLLDRRTTRLVVCFGEEGAVRLGRRYQGNVRRVILAGAAPSALRIPTEFRPIVCKLV